MQKILISRCFKSAIYIWEKKFKMPLLKENKLNFRKRFYASEGSEWWKDKMHSVPSHKRLMFQLLILMSQVGSTGRVDREKMKFSCL